MRPAGCDLQADRSVKTDIARRDARDAKTTLMEAYIQESNYSTKYPPDAVDPLLTRF
ncbi:hypothetical protein E4U12_000304, partial [Claviceps purpurea]